MNKPPQWLSYFCKGQLSCPLCWSCLFHLRGYHDLTLSESTGVWFNLARNLHVRTQTYETESISHSQYRKHSWSDYDSSTKCRRNQVSKGFSKIRQHHCSEGGQTTVLTIFIFPLSWRVMLVISRHKLHRQFGVHFKFFPSHTDFWHTFYSSIRTQRKKISEWV